jgi:hypothetical protein
MLLTEKYQDLIESAKMPALMESEKSTMAVLLENQQNEESKLLAEGTIASDVTQFTPIFMPLARRVMPALIANELLGVQPLNTPTGFIYSLNFRYTGAGHTATDATGGRIKGIDANGNSLSQIVEFDDASALAVGDALAKGEVIYIEGNLVLVKLTDGAVPYVAGDLEGTATVGATYSNELSFRKILKNYTGPVATSAAELLGYDMKEIGFSIVRKSIEAKSRKLKGEYSVEMYQDLKAMHGLNADEELMNMMSLEIQQEMDREIVDFVNTNATVVPDVNPFTIAGGNGARNDVDGYRNLAIKIANEAREIARRTRRGAGNIIIASPKVVTMLEQLKGYQAAPVDTTVNGQVVGTGVVGTFEGKKVIMDVFAPSEYVTVLYKGSDRRDAIGYFAPYVPVSFTRITHEASGQPAIILNTRYGLTTNPLSPEDYARTFSVTTTGALA